MNFCKLVIITIINFLSDGVSDSVPLKMLKTHRLHYIYSWKKWILIILILYITLDYWRNKNFILICYEVKININYSTGRTGSARTVFIFSQKYGVFLLMLVSCFIFLLEINTFTKFNYVIYFLHILLYISGLLCIILIVINR